MKQATILTCFAITLVGLVLNPAKGADVLFMQQGASEVDELLIEFIEALGHNVTGLDVTGGDGDLQIDETAAHDVVYVAESVGSASVHDGLETYIKDVETPQIWAEAFAWDEAALTATEQYVDFGNTQRADGQEPEQFVDGQDSMFIQKPGHPLAGGFTGSVRVYEDPYSLNFGLVETMGPGTDVIASVDEAGQYASLFVYEKGAEMADGSLAAERRIGIWVAQAGDGPLLYDNLSEDGLKMIETAISYSLGLLGDGNVQPQLQPGDADQDLDFDQLDLVKVQVSAKYLTGAAATWGEGDFNGAPGGEQGNPPTGNGLFDQLDIISALSAGKYLTGPYAAIAKNGQSNDGQTSVIYNPTTGELGVDAPAGQELTSINIDSASGIFTGAPAQNLGGSFDNDAANNIFKATFGSSFGSLTFGNVAQSGLSEEFVLNDLSVVGSRAGGGDLGNVDLVYVPEPTTLGMLVFGLLLGLRFRRS